MQLHRQQISLSHNQYNRQFNQLFQSQQLKQINHRLILLLRPKIVKYLYYFFLHSSHNYVHMDYGHVIKIMFVALLMEYQNAVLLDNNVFFQTIQIQRLIFANEKYYIYA